MEVKDIISSGLLELYIMGLTSAEETAQVEAWAMEHAEVKNEIEELQTAMETYAIAHAIQPDASVKQKVLSRIGIINEDAKADAAVAVKNERAIDTDVRKTEGARVLTIPSYLKWAVAACLILLIGSLAINFNYYNKYKSASSELAIAQKELQHQRDVAAAMNKDMEVMTDKNALPVALNGTPHAPDAAAKIYWIKNTGEVYVDPTYLPPAPAGKQYQLWAIVDGKPVDAGMITTPKGTYHIQKMKTFGKAQAFAITLEKAGGSPTPTMDQMYVMAKI